MTLEDELNAYISTKPALIKRSKHPFLPLTIYNYSNEAQWKKHWNTLTIMARGLVTEQETGKIVARPMPKFFNHSEGLHTTPDSKPFSILEKVDGSLGIWFCYEGEWMMATRGSFTGIQALEGAKIAKEIGLEAKCDPAKTYCFEIIYPEDRHVLSYKERRELVLLAVLDTASGFDLPNARLPSVAEELGTGVVRAFSFEEVDFDALARLDRPNEEGFVIRFDETGERLKVKFSTYNEMHRNGLGAHLTKSKKSVEAMVVERLSKDPKDRVENYLDDIPDEFYDQARAAQEQFLKTLVEKENDFDRLVEKLENVSLKEIDPDIPGKGMVCKWLCLVRDGNGTEDEKERIRQLYATSLTAQSMIGDVRKAGRSKKKTGPRRR